MSPGTLYMLTPDMLDDVIKTLKVVGMVNISWGKDQAMLCGDPFAENLPMLQQAAGVGDQSGQGSDEPG